MGGNKREGVAWLNLNKLRNDKWTNPSCLVVGHALLTWVKYIDPLCFAVDRWFGL